MAAKKEVVWSDNHKRNYDNLFSLLQKNKPELLKDSTKENFLININKKLLKEYILSLDFSLSRKETYLFLIARYFEYNKINESFVIDFKQAAYNLKVRRQDVDGDNELDEKEIMGYMTYEELLGVKNSINYEEIKTRREHYKYLLLSLLLETPLRTGFYTTAKFITNQKTEPNINYMMLLGTNVKKAFYYIQKDKVSYINYFNTEENKSIEVEDKQIVNLIYDSYKKYPRTYLFENENNKPFDNTAILRLLKQITNNNHINIDMVRSAYVTYNYSKNITHNEKRKLSHRMRHSTDTASLRYFKNIIEDKDTTELKQENQNLLQDNFTLKTKIKQLEEKIKQYSRFVNGVTNDNNDIINNNETINNNENNNTANSIRTSKYKKLQQDYVYKLNNKKIKKPNEELLNLYNIKYDNTLNKYIKQ